MPTEFTQNVIHIIKNIPKGRVLTYGFIAKLAGKPRAARQVSWVLHSSSKRYHLPWHRVISSNGKLSMKSIEDKQYHKKLLELEGVKFPKEYQIDLKKYFWNIDSIENI
ncbi:MAG: MGMT family protein [Promethearchaeota archaeon]|jgi:methylated-DNA-protein-cysteine methyltransferase-like protein